MKKSVIKMNLENNFFFRKDNNSPKHEIKITVKFSLIYVLDIHVKEMFEPFSLYIYIYISITFDKIMNWVPHLKSIRKMSS